MKLGAKLTYNSAAQVLGKIIGALLGLVAIGIMTRYLESSGFGQYTTIITFASIFAIIADLGLTLVSSQLINKKGVDESKALGNLMAFRIISAVLIIGLAPLLVWLFPYEQVVKEGVVIASLAFFFISLNQVFVSVFQKNIRTDKIAIAETVSRLVLVGGVALVAYKDWQLIGMIWSMVAANFVSFFLHWLFAKRFASFRWSFDKALWLKIFHLSWPLVLTIVSNLVYLKADILILSLMKDQSAVGYYGAAYKVIDVLVTVPFIIAGLILPILVKYWSTGEKSKYYSMTQKFFDVVAVLSLPLVAGGFALGPEVMSLVAGQGFVVAGNILRILIFAVALVFFSAVFTHGVVSLEKQKKLIPYYIFTALTSLPVYYFLIKHYSYYGAAWGTVYSEGLIVLFSSFLFYRYIKYAPGLVIFGKAILASVIMLAFIYLVKSSFVMTGPAVAATVAAGSLVYFAALRLLGGFSSRQLMAIINSKE